MAKNI